MPKKQTKWPKHLQIDVTQANIDEGKCGKPNLCMIKLAVKHAVGGHGYVKVDATGIAITRRDDYREKFSWPSSRHPALLAMVAFDQNKPVKPFSFVANFRKTSNIEKRDQTKVSATRRKRRTEVGPDRKYDIRSRIVGVYA